MVCVCVCEMTKSPYNNRTLWLIGDSWLVLIKKKKCVFATERDRGPNVLIRGMYDNLVYWGHFVGPHKEKRGVCVCVCL